MDAVEKHSYKAQRSFNGADLDCGNGLLLLIRQNLDLLENGDLLEILSQEASVEADLPSWCRLTSNDLISWTKNGKQRSFLICRGRFNQENQKAKANTKEPEAALKNSVEVRAAQITEQDTARATTVAQPIPPLSVMGIGSWPRPAWLMPYLHLHLEGKLSDDKFNEIADDAVRLAVQAQIRAGVSVISDGEQRRDNYASFVGQRLEGCQLIPLTDLLPLVDDPEKFQTEMQSLDVPADKVRHPAVMGKLARKGSITGGELSFLSTISDLAIKIALPGPYLLCRMMWMDCIVDKVYADRKELSLAIIEILKEEIADLLASGVSLVQLDEPVLSEAVFSGAKKRRSFMCGALSERGESAEELAFAVECINAVTESFPQEKLAMHVCRGNWTPDESAALSGSYELLLDVLNSVKVSNLFLEYCTPRAGEISVLKNLRAGVRVGLGSVNPKSAQIESLDSIVQRANQCIEILGVDRVLLNPDCGFATFADNPVSSASIAEAKLSRLAEAAQVLKKQHGLL